MVGNGAKPARFVGKTDEYTARNRQRRSLVLRSRRKTKEMETEKEGA